MPRRGAPVSVVATRGHRAAHGERKSTVSFWEAFVLLMIYVPLLLIWGTSIVDIFRRDDIGGGRKVLWLLTVLILPLVGTLLYLLLRPAGATQRERELLDLATRDVVARYSPDGATTRLQVLAELHDRGRLTDEELRDETSRVLATSSA
jgi:hypothetical protein